MILWKWCKHRIKSCYYIVGHLIIKYWFEQYAVNNWLMWNWLFTWISKESCIKDIGPPSISTHEPLKYKYIILISALSCLDRHMPTDFGMLRKSNKLELVIHFLSLSKSSGWGCKPIWKTLVSENGNLPQIGKQIKHIWNYQLVIFFGGCFTHILDLSS